MKLKKIKVAIDSPAASGAGTISKMLAKEYNLFYCDTGKIYRFFAFKFVPFGSADLHFLVLRPTIHLEPKP